MKKQLFPKELLARTYEVHQFNYSKRSQKIYYLLLFLLLGSLLSLPFVEVSMYTSARGIIKPQEERIPLRITQPGQVTYSVLYPHQLVNKGDTLLRLSHPVLDEQKALVKEQLRTNQWFVHDLRLLGGNPQKPNFRTTRFRKEWMHFKATTAELSTRLHQASLDYHRDKNLFEKAVIAKIEFNKTKLTYDLAKHALSQLKQRMTAQWAGELNNYIIAQKELQSKLKQLEQNQPQYILTAESTGTLLIPEGIPKGDG